MAGGWRVDGGWMAVDGGWMGVDGGGWEMEGGGVAGWCSLCKRSCMYRRLLCAASVWLCELTCVFHCVCMAIFWHWSSSTVSTTALVLDGGGTLMMLFCRQMKFPNNVSQQVAVCVLSLQVARRVT